NGGEEKGWMLRRSGPIAETAAAGTQGRRERGEAAQVAPGVARVDDLLDPEGFGRAQRRLDRLQAGLDLGLSRGRVRRGIDLGTVGGIDPAGDRQRAPLRGGPGESLE